MGYSAGRTTYPTMELRGADFQIARERKTHLKGINRLPEGRRKPPRSPLHLGFRVAGPAKSFDRVARDAI